MNQEVAQHLIQELTITPEQIKNLNPEELKRHIEIWQLCLYGIVGHACYESDIPNKKRHFAQAESIINHILTALTCLAASTAVSAQGVVPEFKRTE